MFMEYKTIIVEIVKTLINQVERLLDFNPSAAFPNFLEFWEHLVAKCNKI